MKLTHLFIYFSWFAFASCSKTESEGTYKTWHCSDKAIIGVLKLDNPSGRTYCKISKIDDQSTKVEEFNSQGLLQETSVFNYQNGKLTSIVTKNKWDYTYEKAMYEYQKDGTYLELNKKEGVNTHLPCKGRALKFEKGMITEINFIGFDNKKCECANRYSKVILKKYDDKNRQGLTKEIAYYGITGQPISNEENYHLVKYNRDNQGNITEASYYGVNIEPIVVDGYHKYKAKFDSNDNQIEIAYFGISGEPTLVDGTYKYIYEYQNGNIVKQISYNTKNEISAQDATNKSKEGIAITKYDYDERGNMIRASYYDKYEKPTISNAGFHLVEYHYEQNNMLKEKVFFGISKKPVSNQWGTHRYYYIRDNFGRVIGETYYDTSQKSVNVKPLQVNMIKYKYDSEGKKISESYWQNESTKMNSWIGKHGENYIYNSQGQETEKMFLADNGNLYVSNVGISRITNTYDNFSRLIETSFFNGDKQELVSGTPTIRNYHKILYHYDNKNRISSIEYYGKESNPINALATITGKESDSEEVQKVDFEYENDKIIRQSWYKKNTSIPTKILDCNDSPCISRFGISTLYLNK